MCIFRSDLDAQHEKKTTRAQSLENENQMKWNQITLITDDSNYLLENLLFYEHLQIDFFSHYAYFISDNYENNAWY